MQLSIIDLSGFDARDLYGSGADALITSDGGKKNRPGKRQPIMGVTLAQ
jgi:hypothetical protein